MRKKVVFLFCVFLFSACWSVYAQSEPFYGLCPTLKISSVYNVNVGDTIGVPVYSSERLEGVTSFFHSFFYDPTILEVVELKEDNPSFDIDYPGEEPEILVQIRDISLTPEPYYIIPSDQPFYTIYFKILKEFESPLELKFSYPGLFLDVEGEQFNNAGISGYIWKTEPESPLEIESFCARIAEGDCSTEELAEIGVTGGQAPYTYKWRADNRIDSLGEGRFKLKQNSLYQLTVTDADSSQVTASYFFFQLRGIDTSYSFTVTQPQTCNDSASVLVQSNGEFDFAWSDTINELNRTNIPPGDYTLVLTNRICRRVDSFFFSINQPELPKLEATIEEPACGDGLGRISLDFEDDILPKSIRWFGTQGRDSLVMEELPPGIYNAVAEWVICQANYPFELERTMILGESIETEIIGAACNRNGSISLTLEDSPSEYSIVWSNGETGASINDLISGDYSVSITKKENSCTTTKNYTVPIRDLNIEIEQSCKFIDGKVLSKISASTNDAPFPVSFTWRSAEDEIFEFDNGPVATSMVMLPSDRLYDLIVTNPNSCSKTIENVNMDCFNKMKSPLNATIETPLLQGDQTLLVPLTMAGASYLKSFHTTVQWRNPRLKLHEIRFGGALKGSNDFTFEEQEGQAVEINWQNRLGSEIFSTGVFCYLVFEISGPKEGPFDFAFVPGTSVALNINQESLSVNEKVVPELGNSATNFDTSGLLTFSFSEIQAFPGDTIEIPLVVNNFDSILAVAGTYSWPVDLLHFIEISDINPVWGQDLNRNINFELAREEGRLPLITTLALGRFIEDGEPFFKLKFKVKEKEGVASVLLSNDFVPIEVFTDSSFYLDKSFLPLFNPGSIQILDLNIWPGDIDRNGRVENEDWLYFGLAQQQTGPPRTDQSGVWVSTPSLNWNTAFPVSRLNLKNADTNGDGTIDLKDSTFIYQNFNRQTPVYPFAFEKNTVFNLTPSLSMEFVNESDTLEASQKIRQPIVLNDINDIPELYGYAFTVDYDTSWIEPNNLKFLPAPGFFGTNTSIHTFQAVGDPGAFQLGVFRENGDGILQNDTLGYLEFSLNAVPKNLEVDTLSLSLSDIVLMDTQERRYPSFGDQLELPVRFLVSSDQEVNLRQNLKLYPVPASERVFLELENGRVTQLEVYSMDGSLKNVFRGFDLRSVTLTDWQPGMYLFQITTTQGKTRRLIPIH